MEDYIFQVEVPTREEVTEIKNGKRKQVQRKVLPGYILVRMDLDDRVVLVRPQHPGRHRLRRATDRVDRPSPLTPRRGPQVARSCRAVEPKKAKPRGQGLDFEVGDSVTVTDGAVRLAAGDDQRDQRRPAEAQGAGLDLRPRDPGRAELQPGLKIWTPRSSRSLRCPCVRPLRRPARAARVDDPGAPRSHIQPRNRKSMPPKKRKLVSDLHAAAARRARPRRRRPSARRSASTA